MKDVQDVHRTERHTLFIIWKTEYYKYVDSS